MQQMYCIIGLPGAFLSPTSKKKKKKKKKKHPEKVSYISRNGFFLSFMREFSDIKKLKKPLCKNVLGNGTF